MRILGIETATSICGAALADEGVVLAERVTDRPHGHSEQLLSLIDQCLRAARTDRRSIDGIAVSIGPGSFTGLRIGLSVGKGLAFALGKPLAGIGTLEALAWNALRSGTLNPDAQIAPVIDARRDELYAALYRISGEGLAELLSPRPIRVADFAARLLPGQSVMLVGDGAAKTVHYLEAARPEMRTSVTLPLPAYARCSAAAVAHLGWRKLTESPGADLAAIEPEYGKEFFTLLQHQHSSVS